MEEFFIYTIVNFNVTLLFRMIQRQSPFKIRLSRIRQYDTPFGVHIDTMKLLFAFVTLYMGFPVSRITLPGFAALYLFIWFVLIYWWYFFSICHFKYCIYLSSLSTIALLVQTAMNMSEWIPVLIWSVYITYISIWYNMSYVKSNFIFS